MISRFLKGIAVRGAELAMGLVLVLVLFVFFMGILSISFPAGTSLTDLIGYEEASAAIPTRASLDLDLEIGEEERGERLIAMLSRVRRSVKDKPADAIAWKESRSGLKLRNRHAIQTFSMSGATITFNEENRMSLGENTLVILKSWTRDQGSGNRRASLVVLDGQLRGRISVSKREKMEVEIIAATDAATLRAQTKPGKESDFTVKVNKDKSSTFSVFSGTGEVTTSNETVVVSPNHAVTVDETGTAGAIEALPTPPERTRPPDGKVFHYRTDPIRIRFGWTAQDDTELYRLQIARDRKFEKIVHDSQVSKTTFTHGNLEAGKYYWRVNGLRGRLEGSPGAVGSLQVIHDRDEPLLNVGFPDGVVRADAIVLRGEAESGTSVFINDAEVPVDQSGSFTYTLQLVPGLNVIVVEAIDTAGNVAYRSHHLEAQF